MSLRLLALLCGALLLTGCNEIPGAPQLAAVVNNADAGPATGVQSRLAAWKGQPVEELLTVWGAPKSTLRLSRGGSVLSYALTKEEEGRDHSKLVSSMLGGSSIARGVGEAFNDQGKVFAYACVVNVRVSGRGRIEEAVVSQQDNPFLEDLCARLVRPVPIRA